jgi:hypothetical protein
MKRPPPAWIAVAVYVLALLAGAQVRVATAEQQQPAALGGAVPTPAPFPSPVATAQGAASPAPRAVPTAPTGRRLAAFAVVARRIAFYSNRYVMEADGDVAITLGDGTRITGKTFFYDLRLNRFVIAGGVRLAAAGREIDGAAFAEYFDFDRAYFVPVLSQPDRWTFASGDYAHPTRFSCPISRASASSSMPDAPSSTRTKACASRRRRSTSGRSTFRSHRTS